MARLMYQVERWHLVRLRFVAGDAQIPGRKIPLWRSYALAVSLANDPCDEMKVDN